MFSLLSSLEIIANTVLNFNNDHNSLQKQKHKGKASCMQGSNYLSIMPGFRVLEKPLSFEVLQAVQSHFSKVFMFSFLGSHSVTGPCLVSYSF
jgi:hypothetical protein